MKIFICWTKVPTAKFYRKFLQYLLSYATRKEIEGYLNDLERS